MATGVNGENRSAAEPHIIVRDLTMAYGSFVLMRDLNFVVRRGDIFIIMGGSGCGKSTLLRHLIGLKDPATGEIVYGDINFTRAEPSSARVCCGGSESCTRAARCGAR
jgi:phospholipid/cholesterol/gamma-HCH transport system ATP-binding protein